MLANLLNIVGETLLTLPPTELLVSCLAKNFLLLCFFR